MVVLKSSRTGNMTKCRRSVTDIAFDDDNTSYGLPIPRSLAGTSITFILLLPLLATTSLVSVVDASSSWTSSCQSSHRRFRAGQILAFAPSLHGGNRKKSNFDHARDASRSLLSPSFSTSSEPSYSSSSCWMAPREQDSDDTNNSPTLAASSSAIEDVESKTEDLKQRTIAHVQRIMHTDDDGDDDTGRGTPTKKKSSASELSSTAYAMERLYKQYLSQSGNSLKLELQKRRLPSRGRKPDLATRLAKHDLILMGQYEDDSFLPPGLDGNTDVDLRTLHGDTSLPVKIEIEKTVKNANDDSTTSSDDVSKDDAVVSSSSKTASDTATPSSTTMTNPVNSFCGIFPLSDAASHALTKAQFRTGTPIQQATIPMQMKGESIIMHAETGSGKSLAYLLPITEYLWRQMESDVDDDIEDQFALVMTPTRELAAQIAGVASVLAPPGSVRMVSYPTNLMSDGNKDRGETIHGGRPDRKSEFIKKRGHPWLIIGSAKAIQESLYGNKKMPASPTTKPEAKFLLQHTRWIVLDEVDRLLQVRGKKKNDSKSSANVNSSSNNNNFKGSQGSVSVGRGGHYHEKPAAVVTSAVTRYTYGRAQVVAASATVGRSLKRELSRVLGLTPKEAPRVIRTDQVATGDDNVDDDDDEDIDEYEKEDIIVSSSPPPASSSSSAHVGRAVTIPSTVKHFIFSVDTDSSVGQLLTNTFFILREMNKYSSSLSSGGGNDENKNGSDKKILMVLSKTSGISTSTAIGALQHFKCQPKPISLLDALQQGPHGTDHLIDAHRKVSGATGIGESAYFDAKKDDDTSPEQEQQEANDTEGKEAGQGYLLVTGEDSIRGLHLDGLDFVIVVGKANSVDEYTHIAGRTGRAGRLGSVINVLSQKDTKIVHRWETMLGIQFQSLTLESLINDLF